MEDRDLAGEAVIVSGAAHGIGKAIARAFARQGARVLIADLQDEKGEEVAAELRETGATAEYIHADVSRAAEVQAMVDRAKAAFGGVDILVNNAMHWNSYRPLTALSEEDWDRDLAVLLKSSFLTARAALPCMRAGGSIINLSSVHGLLASANWATYDVSKAAIVQLTRVMACEFGPQGIRANAIAPGIISTDASDELYAREPDRLRRHQQVSPLRDVGRPEDIAEAAVFLASNRARFITGHTLVVDGGLTLSMQLTVAQEQWRAFGIDE